MFSLKNKKYGNIRIPELRINLPLYEAESGKGQAIVDRKRSACLMKGNGYTLIMDHSGQDGFERLSKAVPYKTIAYVNKDAYICINKQVGHIYLGPPNRLVDENWQSIKYDSLILYTCLQKSAENIMDVQLTYWKKLNG